MLQKISTFADGQHAQKDVPLFADVHEPRIVDIVNRCQVVHVGAGAKIANAADKQACVYIVLQGALCARTGNAEDHPRCRQDTKILPRESIGELSVFDNATHFSTLFTLEESELLIIEPHILWRLIDESDSVARILLRQLSLPHLTASLDAALYRAKNAAGHRVAS